MVIEGLPTRTGAVLVGLVAIVSLTLSPPARADGLTDTLNQSCGTALANLDCSDVATGWPLALGGVIGVIEVVKGQMSGADDCEAKLSGGSSLVGQASQYIDIPGLPVGQIGKCACKIVYSTATCSGEVQKVVDALGSAAKKFFALLGIGDYHAPPDDPELDKAEYYNAHYEPLADKLMNLNPGEDEYVITMKTTTQACVDDWDPVPWVSDALHELCGPFYKKLAAEIGARQKVIADQIALEQKQWKEKQEAEHEKWQKQQDAATDNARKLAMSWASIKRDTYGKQCRDIACRNEVTALAFFYYGEIATGMQNLANSNTQVLVAANAKFEPLFKEKVAASVAREATRLESAARSQLKLVAVNAPRMRRYHTALDQVRGPLEALGLRDAREQKRFLVNAYATGYALSHSSRRPGRAGSGMRPRPVDETPPAVQVRPRAFGVRPREVAKSTLCRFTSGPRRGQVQDYAPMAPLPVGSSCQDARGSSGLVVAP